MFMVVLLVIAKRWGEKPKGPSADKWIKCGIYLYNELLFSNKKKWRFGTCYNMYEPLKHYAK